uniref:Uncharacterized protein n=1 Tax=Arundo donax TaxID=35708 RepID=A0A0A9BD26_ARUDO
MSIETLLDILILSIEEVAGRMKVVEDRIDPPQSSREAGKLLLKEEQ